MEQQNKRRKLSLKCQRQSLKKEKKQLKFVTPLSKSSIQTLSNRRPMTGRKKQPIKSVKCKSTRNSLQFDEFLQENYRPSTVEQVYYSKQLNLSDNSFIFDEDVFKLQNLITGGYCCDEEFMSISKFNKSKDNFVLLHQIYEKAKVHPRVKLLQKKPLVSRNVFSMIYLNQNLKKMGKKQTNTIFQRLKVVR